MFGAISRQITCVPRAPDRRARPTKSRETSEKVWARIARAAHGQAVAPIRIASITSPRTLRYVATMMSTASVGITSTTFVNMLRISSTTPPR